MGYSVRINYEYVALAMSYQQRPYAAKAKYANEDYNMFFACFGNSRTAEILLRTT
jgi:hypothetical protein